MEYSTEFLTSSFGKEFVAGGFGGTAGVISSYPLDTLRVIMQQRSNSGSAFNIFKNVWTKEGPTGLYRGMGVPLASIAFQNAMVFQSYAIFTKLFSSSSSSNGPPSMMGVALGGLGAGAIQSLLMCPVELVKIRRQLQNSTSTYSSCQLTTTEKSPLKIAKNIWKNEGFRGMYRGLGITVLRDAPAHTFYFCTYEYMREKLHPGCRESSTHESWDTMYIAGGLAGIASWILNYPTDVIKTRLQAQTPSSMKYKGIVDCTLKIIREEGHVVLWRGLGATLVRAFVMNSAIFPAYEISLRCLYKN